MQLASFFFFTCVYLRFLYRMRKYENHIWTRDQGLKWYNDWRALAGAMFVSCVGILVRVLFRPPFPCSAPAFRTLMRVRLRF